MIAKILQPKNLYKAYRKVYQNKGSSGIDGMEIENLRGHLSTYQKDLVREVLNGDYLPQAIRGVEIPKSRGKRRLLGIPTVVDRWLQQAVSQQLMSRFEIEFSENSYGFRPKKNLHQGLTKSLTYINDGYQDIVDIDLRSFFDEVPHYKMLQLIYNKMKCRVTMRLIRKWLRAPIMKGGKLYRRRKGLPQGSPLSPLLSNILLDELDKYLEMRGYRFIRFADDFSIYTKSKAEARRVGNEIYRYLRDKLCLPINRAKSGIRRPSTFTALGHSFVPIYKKGNKGQYQMVASKSSWGNLKRKLKRVTKKTLPYSLTERISRIKLIYQGWINNYRLASIYTKLKKVDEWLRNRLRYCIWHNWIDEWIRRMNVWETFKRRNRGSGGDDRKRKNFIRLGIEKGQAYAWSRTRMGGWAVAQSPMLKTTITVTALKHRGYEPMIDYYYRLKHSI